MYQLFCDSNCELWHTDCKALGLKVIRMPYLVEGKEYYYDMGENTDFKAFYDAMRGGDVPKTQALNQYDYVNYFEPVLKEGKDIYYITFSHKLSGTFQHMELAIKALKEQYPDRTIRYIDSKAISLPAGLIVYHAALLWKDGASMDELEAFVKDFSVHLGVFFAVDSLTYLKRGGRISPAVAAIGNLLALKPILTIASDGTLQNLAKVKGSKKVISELVNYVSEYAEDIEKYRVYVFHGDCEDRADELATKLNEAFGGKLNIVKQVIGPVIGAHSGPGTLAVTFHASKRAL